MEREKDVGRTSGLAAVAMYAISVTLTEGQLDEGQGSLEVVNDVARKLNDLKG